LICEAVRCSSQKSEPKDKAAGKSPAAKTAPTGKEETQAKSESGATEKLVAIYSVRDKPYICGLQMLHTNNLSQNLADSVLSSREFYDKQ